MKNHSEPFGTQVFPNVYVKDIDRLSAEQKAVLTPFCGLQQAMIDADKTALESFYPEDYILVHMSGKRQTRDEYIADILSGDLDYYNCYIDKITVTISGDTAALSCRTVLDASPYGFGRSCWTLHPDYLYGRENGEWHIQTGDFRESRR